MRYTRKRQIDRRSKKKLRAGLGYFFANSKARLPFDCASCDEKQNRNCGNQFMMLAESVIDIVTEHNIQELAKLDHRGKKISKVSPNLGGLRFYECPLGWITRDTNIIIQLLTFEKSPTFIFHGTWIDQPTWYVESVQIYNLMKYEWLKKQKG